jgi:hypothetical protein
MKNLKYGSLLALVLIPLTGSLQAGTPPIRITSGQTITVPGNYILINDYTSPNGGGLAFRISASNVTLNLGGHTVTSDQGINIDQFDTGGLPLTNARVYNGRIVNGGGAAVSIHGSDCLVYGLNIKTTAVTGCSCGTGIEIQYGQYNHVHDCVLTGQEAEWAFHLFFDASHNTIQNCTLAGFFLFTIDEQDQAGAVGDNNFIGVQWANPTP